MTWSMQEALSWDGSTGRAGKRYFASHFREKEFPAEQIEEAMAECYETEDTEQAIRELLREKRKYDPETADWKETQKGVGLSGKKRFPL